MHIHNPIRNLVQRLDGADEKWRMLDSRALYGAKLGIAADVSCALKSALRAESFHLTARADGNEFEVAGVEHKENDFFSSRRARIGPEIERLVGAFQVKYGRAPSEAELWSIRQHATLATRPRKESSAPLLHLLPVVTLTSAPARQPDHQWKAAVSCFPASNAAA